MNQMSMAIIDKRVNEKFAIGFVYSTPDISTGETIASATVTVPTGLTAVGTPVIVPSTLTVSQVVSGGTAGVEYTVVFKVTTSVGYIYENCYIVRVI
jgi:hypothetical protein